QFPLDLRYRSPPDGCRSLAGEPLPGQHAVGCGTPAVVGVAGRLRDSPADGTLPDSLDALHVPAGHTADHPRPLPVSRLVAISPPLGGPAAGLRQTELDSPEHVDLGRLASLLLLHRPGSRP